MGDSIAMLSAATASDVASRVTTKISNSLIPLVDEIRELVAEDFSGDPITHAKLLSKIQALKLAAETPPETIFRIGYQSWQNAAIRVALDLGIFEVLGDRGPNPVTAEELASRHGADVVLVGMSNHKCTFFAMIGD